MTRTILITGSTDGLGRAVATRLAGDGEQLILHGRRPDALAALADELTTDGVRPRTVLADLASLEQVHELAAEVAELTAHPDVLVNNAGIGVGDPADQTRALSADGYELRFAVNHLAAFDLMLRLLPRLQAAEQGRIVQVASAGQARIDWDDVMLERGYTGWGAYRQSKLAQVCAGLTLAERLAGTPVTVNSLHPGSLMPTSMVRESRMESIDTLESGVDAALRLVSAPELATTSGRYVERTVDTRAHEAAYDEDYRARVWALSLELTGAPDAASPR